MVESYEIYVRVLVKRWEGLVSIVHMTWTPYLGPMLVLLSGIFSQCKCVRNNHLGRKEKSWQNSIPCFMVRHFVVLSITIYIFYYWQGPPIAALQTRGLLKTLVTFNWKVLQLFDMNHCSILPHGKYLHRSATKKPHSMRGALFAWLPSGQPCNSPRECPACVIPHCNEPHWWLFSFC